MTDPKAEALARLSIEHDICCLGAGYDARDEEVAALKAECERLRAALENACGVLQSEADCLLGDHRPHCCGFVQPETCDCDGPQIREALAAADRKDGEP